MRICRAQSNSGSSTYNRAARSIYFGEKSLAQVVEDLNNDLSWIYDNNGNFKTSFFSDFIGKKFNSNGDGFYAWSDLRYFLFEYEEKIKVSRNQPKLGWRNFVKSESDKVSIEHIYPQTPTSEYWINRFSAYSEDEQNHLRGSLGNLLPLSSSINSSLQNDDFPDKKNIKTNADGSIMRNGYANGSYSELEVAREAEWTVHQIMERGLKLLEFMESRWNINFGSKANKLSVLHLSFLECESGESVVESGKVGA
jgi:hypothetical protein